MPPPKDSLIQECSTCGALIDVSGEEPFALMHCPTCGAALRVRRHFDHFELQELLGVGGMGTVYRALDLNLNRSVALKLLQQQNSASPEFITQFQKEASITASINHPHVVKVYSTGRDHGLFYIAMELVDKGSLESLMDTAGRVAEAEVLNVGIQIAQGLNAALERGLIHRDIKPGNILFANATTAKIVDFGLAILMEHAGVAAGEVWATPFYVAPETVEGKPEDFRSDMYSLGAALFHALIGRPPHPVESNSMSELAAAKSKPVNVRAVAPDVSSPTAFLLNKVLNRDPAERYQSYGELIEHLEFARAELLERDSKNGAKSATAEKERDYGWLTLAVTAVVVLSGILCFEFGGRFFPKAPSAMQEEEGARDPERIDVRYEQTRQVLASGDAAKAAEAFARLAGETDTPQPLQNWITLHAGLAELLAGQAEKAQAWFAALEARGLYSPDPAEQPLANFFVATAHRAAGAQIIPAAAIKDVNRDSYETIALFVFAVKDWSLGEYDEAWQLFRQFSLCTPQDRFAWISTYKPLSSPYLAEINAYRTAAEATRAAGTLESRKQALGVVKGARVQCKLASQFPAKLEAFENDLEQKITAEETARAVRLAAIEAADARTLSDAKTKIAAQWQQFRPADAEIVARAVQVTGEKGRAEREALLKKMGWLAKFKTTLIGDLNTIGYAAAVPKKNGSQLPGPVRRASESQVETIIPFGSVTASWTDLSPDGVIAMGKSFLRTGLPADVLADRQWQLGVYAFHSGKTREGRDLLILASQAKPEYRGDLDLFLETASTQ